jgi:hypothetical protein
MSYQTLYQRLLGDDFDKLPAVLRNFHSLPHGGRALGTVTVRRKAGLLRHQVTRILRLPPVGEGIPVRLQVLPTRDGELWRRHFGEHCVETMQWQDGDFLIEKAGLLCFVFRVLADENGLRFEFQNNRLHKLNLSLGSPLPVAATARGFDKRWHIGVSIASPLLGVLTTYEGEMTPVL